MIHIKVVMEDDRIVEGSSEGSAQDQTSLEDESCSSSEDPSPHRQGEVLSRTRGLLVSRLSLLDENYCFGDCVTYVDHKTALQESKVNRMMVLKFVTNFAIWELS